MQRKAFLFQIKIPPPPLPPALSRLILMESISAETLAQY